MENAHAGLQVHTADSQMVFVTATSRLSNKRLNLAPGESAKVVFAESEYVRGCILTPDLPSHDSEVPGNWLYYNPRLKKIIMTGDDKNRGFCLNASGFSLDSENQNANSCLRI